MAIFTSATRRTMSLDAETTTESADQKKVGTFVTLQSLTFPIASGAVVAMWRILKEVDAELFEPRWWPLIFAAVIVVANVAYGWSGLSDGGQKVGGVLIALANIVLVAAAAIGVDVTDFLTTIGDSAAT